MDQTSAQEKNFGEEVSYENVAFISYKRENNDVAAWLRKKLVWYRFPAKLVAPESHPPHPKYIRPVIRDKTSLEVDPGPFWEKIKQKIEDSQFLIVLCSPMAARPDRQGRHWVQEEVRHFLSNPGRHDPYDHVIPVIIEGIPGTGGDDECLPPALRVPQILSRTLPRIVQDKGETEKECRENALIQVISCLLRVNRGKIFDEYQRAKQRKIQHTLGVVSMLLIGFAAITGWALWERNQAERTLAQANFQEASRLLDQGDTGLALAYLGRSLKNVAYSPAMERLHGLLMQRSWLIRRDREAPISGKFIPLAVSPGLDRLAGFQGEPSTGKGRVVIDAIIREKSLKAIDIPVDAQPKALFSPDGSAMILFKGNEKQQSVEVRSVTDGTKLGGFDVPVGSRIVGISSTGKIMIIESSDNTLRLVVAATGQQILELPIEAGRSWSGYAFDEDSALFAMGDETAGQPTSHATHGLSDTHFTGLDLAETGQQMLKLQIEPGRSWPESSFDEDDAIFVVADETAVQPTGHATYGALESLFAENRPSYRLRSFRLVDGKEILNVAEQGKIGKFACSPAGTHVVYTASSDTVYDWQLVAVPLQENVDSWRHSLAQSVQRLEFSPDGRRIVTETYLDAFSDSGSLLSFYDVFNGEKKDISIQLSKTVKDWAFSHDARRLAVLTNAPELRVINLRSGKEAVERLRLDGVVSSVAFSRNDCSLLLSTQDGIISFDLQVSPVAPRRITPSLSSMVIADVVPSPDKRHIALLLTNGETRGGIELRTVNGGKPGDILPLNQVPNCAAFSPDGRIFAVGTGRRDQDNSQGHLILFHVPPDYADAPKQWKPLPSVTIPAAITHLEFSPDGKLLLLAGSPNLDPSRKLHLYEVASGELLPDFIEHDAPIDAAHFSPDSRRVATAGSDKRVCLWDLIGRTRIAQVQSHSFPETVDFGPDGSIAYSARFLNSEGEVLVLTPTGEPAWREARRFTSGMSRVAFDSAGRFLAVGSRGKEVVILDLKTGRPRTAPISLKYPISSLQFISADSETALCVSGGNPQAGYVAYFSPKSGRLIGDIIKHNEYVRGVEPTPAGRVLSWTLDTVLVSPNPVALRNDDAKRQDFIGMTGVLGGWVLNEWEAPEPYHRDAGKEVSVTGLWAQTWFWLHESMRKRAIEPGSQVGILERLRTLSEGYLEEYEAVLDVKPDFALALAAYWLPAAKEVLKEEFMRPVHGKPRIARLQLELEWNRQSSEEVAAMLLNSPAALRIADFHTKEACEKLPNAAEVWRERATFLRLTDKTDDAFRALEHAIDLDPSDIYLHIQLALLLLGQGKDDVALDRLNRACEKISRHGTEAIGSIVALGVFRMETSATQNGFEKIPAHVSWLTTEIKKRMKSEVNLDALLQLLDCSQKVSKLLNRFPDGPKIARDFNLQLAGLIQEKKVSTKDDSFVAGLLANASYCALLSGDVSSALRYSQRAVLLTNDMPPIQLIYAHSLCASGKSEEAAPIYRKMMEIDPVYGGLIVRSLYQDFLSLERRGITLKGIKSLKKEISDKIAGEFDKGFTVTAVRTGSQAEDVGVLVGDRIIRYKNEPIVDLNEFIWDRQMEEHSNADDLRPILVVRVGKQLKLYVKPGLLGVGLIRTH